MSISGEVSRGVATEETEPLPRLDCDRSEALEDRPRRRFTRLVGAEPGPVMIDGVAAVDEDRLAEDLVRVRRGVMPFCGGVGAITV